MSKTYMVVQTHSYDGESVDEVEMLDGPFYKEKEAKTAFNRIAEDYEEDEEASVDLDNYCLTAYDGNGEIINILIMEF